MKLPAVHTPAGSCAICDDWFKRPGSILRQHEIQAYHEGDMRICTHSRPEFEYCDDCVKERGSGNGRSWLPQPVLSDSRVAKFDDAIKTVTDQRGSVYGHPKHDFGRADRLKAVVAECKDPLARHALEMICVKVARLIQTPTHLDSWIDIAGYARTGVMVTDTEK